MKSRRTALAVLIASFLWAGTLCASAETGKKHPATDANGLHYAIGAEFFFGNNADIYLVSKHPLTLLYVQWFKDLPHNAVYRGAMIMSFELGSVEINGLGLGPAPMTSYEKRNKELGGDFLRSYLVSGRYAPDLYPYYHKLAIGGEAVFWQGIVIKINGREETPGLIIRSQDRRSTISLYENVAIGGRGLGTLLGKVSYPCDTPRAPWYFTADVNGDGNSEILVGQAMYNRKILVILTTTPKSFKALRDYYELTMDFGDEWPQSGTEVFKKGFTKRIPLK